MREVQHNQFGEHPFGKGVSGTHAYYHDSMLGLLLQKGGKPYTEGIGKFDYGPNRWISPP